MIGNKTSKERDYIYVRNSDSLLAMIKLAILPVITYSHYIISSIHKRIEKIYENSLSQLSLKNNLFALYINQIVYSPMKQLCWDKII